MTVLEITPDVEEDAEPDVEPDVEPDEPDAEPDEMAKSNHQIASEVIAGYWGRGNDRKNRLQKAGYDVAAVSEEMSKILKH